MIYTYYGIHLLRFAKFALTNTDISTLGSDKFKNPEKIENHKSTKSRCTHYFFEEFTVCVYCNGT